MRPASEVPISQQRCFPAGHASGGYKMLIGDHFLSHTITTMLLAWLIINLLAVADRLIFRPAPMPDARKVPKQRETAFTETIA